MLSFSSTVDSQDALESPGDLSPADLLLESVADSFVVVWTDGACQLQDNP